MAETKGKFRVGDYVRIKNFSERKFDFTGDILIKWANDCMGTNKDMALTVLKNFNYRDYYHLPYVKNSYIVRGYIMVNSEYRYIIENESQARVYITLESNLEYRAKRMTKAEIEAELGYKIEIVEDKEN